MNLSQREQEGENLTIGHQAGDSNAASYEIDRRSFHNSDLSDSERALKMIIRLALKNQLRHGENVPGEPPLKTAHPHEELVASRSFFKGMDEAEEQGMAPREEKSSFSTGTVQCETGAAQYETGTVRLALSHDPNVDQAGGMELLALSRCLTSKGEPEHATLHSES